MKSENGQNMNAEYLFFEIFPNTNYRIIHFLKMDQILNNCQALNEIKSNLNSNRFNLG